MKIVIVCPAPPRSRLGNRVTAMRWRRILTALGHGVTIVQDFAGGPCDLLVALHARRSHATIQAYRRHFPLRPLVVALTGTDLYRDLPRSRLAQASLDLADYLIVLQPHACTQLLPSWREKARVIRQSTTAVGQGLPRAAGFQVCVLGHLRSVKDPFRAALALQLLPASVDMRIIHAGKALTPAMAPKAHQLMAREPRYRWVGEWPRWRARRLLARSHLLVISSRMEGGANVVSEALVQGVPVLASAVSGNIGMLGEDYPGYFPVGDTEALAELLQRAASDPVFYRDLTRRCRRLAPLYKPARELQAWRQLLAEVMLAEKRMSCR